MTSNDLPPAGPGRRRALGRGPGATTPPAPAEPARPRSTTPPDEQTRPDAPAATAEPEPPRAPEQPDGPARPRTTAAPGRPTRPETATPTSDEPARSGPARSQVPAAPVEAAVPAAVEPTAAAAPAVSAAPVVRAEGETLLPRPAGGPGSVDADGDEEGSGIFKVRLANFEGPFDLLLQLIAKHKLDVTEVALSKVTDEFMAYIRAMGPDWDLDETTEFLVVAATLLDLKAARLLPAAEVEDEADLALLEARDLLFARLLQYRAYKRIADIFNRRLDEEARRYPRTVGLEPQHAALLPEVVISIGPEGFARLAVKAMQPKPRPQVYVDHIHAPLVSVQEQAAIVVARLRELGETGFRTLVEDTDDTLTVVARFLALLELYREKAVALEQETALGELTVRWTGGDGDGTPKVTDEFDRPPEPPEKTQEERKP
ncbi:segregation and condensation protein A [Streptomyces similanensis]|uniref:segregation and condensation protein A n=1 Tax=Streptomyces similanensis TaxID=1274988 RepID=UPI0031EAAFC5